MIGRFARLWPLAAALAGVVVACSNDDSPGPTPPSGGSAGNASGSSAAGEGGRALGSAGMPTGGVAEPSNGGAPAPGGAGGLSDAASAGAAGAAGGGGEGASGLHFDAYPPSPYPSENPDSDAKALLGKILFWEEQLGGDGTVACGTCHRGSAGGSDPRSATAAAAQPGPDGVLGSEDDIHGSLGVVRCNPQGVHTGVSVQVTGRKAPTYLDAMFASRLFWDGRAECSKVGCPKFDAFEDPDAPGTFPIKSGGALENQAVGPPLSPVEMACEEASWPAIHSRLQAATPLAHAKQIPQAMADFIAAGGGSYPELFKAAFGDAQTSGPQDEINTRRIAFAIATHERRLRSDQTPWDRWNAGESDALTAAQVRGFDVFVNKGRCHLCHAAPTFTDGDFHFIGFHEPAWDLGRKAIDATYGAPGAMRTPTLRNVSLREAGGLLHNGAGPGSSLVEVIDLYDQGGLRDNPVVMAVPIDATMRPLELTEDEKADLLDFLRHGLEDPRVAAQTSPFDRPLLGSE